MEPPEAPSACRGPKCRQWLPTFPEEGDAFSNRPKLRRMKRDPTSNSLPGTRSDPAAQEAPGDLVSIVIPAYNYARYLPDAVDSALAQTWRPLEIILVDDGSTDSTPELMASRYGEEALVRYVRQENQGLSAARNTGIAEARGGFLVFLDADDKLVPEMVALSIKALERLGPEFAAVAHRAFLMDEVGDPLPDRLAFPERETEVLQIDLLVMNRFSPNLMVRRKPVVAAGGFDTALKACEDRDLWIRLAGKHRILRLGERLSWSRRHGANMSSDGKRQTESIRKVLRKAREAGCLRGADRMGWAKIYAMFHYQSALLALNSSPTRAVARILWSLALWPWFPDARDLGQARPLFRCRTLLWIASGRWRP